MISLIPFFFSFFIYQAQAFDGNSMAMHRSSIQWQRIDLEKNIKEKIHDVISPIIKSGEYIIKVDVKLKDNIDPTISGGGGGPEGSDNKNAQKKKSKVSLTDIDPKLARADYIVFSKIGMESPIFPEENVDANGKPESEPPNIGKSLLELNKTLDLFQYIESIKINVNLDDFLGDETKDTINKLLTGLDLTFSGIKASLDITYLDMKEIKKGLTKIDPNLKRKEDLELYSKFGTAVGLVLTALLLSLVGFLLFKKYSDLQERLAEINKPQETQSNNEKSEDDKDKENEEESLSPASMTTNANEALSNVNGIDRFRMLLKSRPQSAGIFIKKWIKDQSNNAKSALILIVQELESSELTQIFDLLNLNDREEWKGKLDKVLTPEEEKQAHYFINTDIIQEQIVPSLVTDEDAIDLLLTLTPEKAAEFIQAENQFAPILMNVMTSSFINQMIKNFDAPLAEKVITQSVFIDKDTLISNIESFKEKLTPFANVQKRSQFLSKILEMLPEAGPSTEEALFKGIAVSGSLDLLLQNFKVQFPNSLLGQLSDEALSKALQTYSRTKRVELIVISDENTANKMMNLIAPENTKARDMLNLDLEKFSDELAKKRLLDKKEDVHSDYLKHVRSLIRNDESFYALNYELIKNHAESLIKNYAQTTKQERTLKAA
jgi:hypothetical protein